MSAETLEQARQQDRLGRRIQVLVLVKTTPNPSTSYVDTVCVAGIALSPGPARWVRLYPIAFRHLDQGKKFQKYSIVDVEVRQPSSDPRAESLRVSPESINVIEEPGNWVERHDLILSVPETTTCTLNAGIRKDANGTSLGIVRPHDVKIEIQRHRGWSKRQLDALRKWSAQPAFELEGFEHKDAPPLQCPTFQAWYRYRCTDPDCRGHRQGILDWELTAVQRRAEHDHADIEERIRHHFYDKMFKDDRSQWFILGNNAEASKRGSFSVLSVYWPPTKDVKKAEYQSNTLF